MTGMLHGRAQLQTVTIGGQPRRQRARLPARRARRRRRLPARSARSCRSSRGMMAPGVYDIPKVESRARALVTNTTPTGAYRGAGRPEATAAIERAMDLFAAEIGMDPAEVRRRNFIAAGQVPVHHEGRGRLRHRRVREGARPGARGRRVRRAAGRAGRAPRARRRRAARASACRCTSRSPAAASSREDAAVEVHADGTVTVLTGTSPHGQGHATAWAMLASEHLGIPIEKITVMHGDTDLIPRGIGTMGSRSLQTGGVAVYQAAGELVELAKQRAADLLEASAEDLEVAEGRVARRRAPAPASTSRELAEKERLRVDSDVRQRGADVPVRRARRGRRGRRRVRQGGGRPDHHRRRRGPGAQPAARRGAAPRRHRAGHLAGAARGGRLRRGRQPAHRPRSPTTRSRPRPSCRASRWSAWPTRGVTLAVRGRAGEHGDRAVRVHLDRGVLGERTAAGDLDVHRDADARAAPASPRSRRRGLLGPQLGVPGRPQHLVERLRVLAGVVDGAALGR